MRILIRTSKWAIWARRLASLAGPLLVIPVFMHRAELITSDVFNLIEVTAGLVALLALVFALIALVRLWFSGDEGWSKAIWAMVLALIYLSPFVWAIAQAARYPAANDIASAPELTLPLISRPQFHNVLTAASIEEAFPNVTTRRYPLDSTQMWGIVQTMVEARGWEIRASREPIDALDSGTINAVVTTFLGWQDEVVLRIGDELEGSSVDMRSVSLSAGRDLGANGKRIEEFLVALDTEVTALIRDNPNILQPVDAEPGTAAPNGAPVPAQRRGR